jgi:hypothetical protein
VVVVEGVVWTIEVFSVVILDVSSAEVVWGGVVYIIVVVIADVRLLLVVTVSVSGAEVALFVIVLDDKVEAVLLSKMGVVESEVR